MRSKLYVNKYAKIPSPHGTEHAFIKKKNINSFIKLFDDLVAAHGSQNAVESKYNLNRGLYSTMRDKGELTALMAKRILNAHREED